MLTGLLPIGSVVLLKNSTKRLMIIGLCQSESQDGENGKIWDYAGCLYPEGYISADRTFLFDENQIEKIYAVGYQDEEQFAFKSQIDAVREELRNQASEDSE